MNAKETKFFQHEGFVTETVEVPALEVQRKTLDMTLKVKGMNAPDKFAITDKDGEDLEWVIRVVAVGDVKLDKEDADADH